MQPSTITLVVNPGTGDVTKVFGRYDSLSGRSTYTEANHTLIQRDMMNFYRTEAKRNGNFLGVAKSAAKFTVDQTVLDAEGNSITAPIIVDVSISNPMGTTAANTKLARLFVAEFLVSDEAADLMDKLEI